MSTPLPSGATSGATSYHDVCLDGQTPKAKGMTVYPGHNWRVFVIHNFQSLASPGPAPAGAAGLAEDER